MINYNNKIFKIVENHKNGEVSNETIFKYEQHNNIVVCTYSGGLISLGQLLGLVDINGNIEMRYHQINLDSMIKTGKCFSRPVILKNGKIRLYETWEWTFPHKSSGTSILEEQ